MKYKVIEKVNPRDPKGPKKRYASPVKAGNLTLKDLAKEIFSYAPRYSKG